MSHRRRGILSSCALASLLLLCSNDTHAQCSGGRGGSMGTGPGASLNNVAGITGSRNQLAMRSGNRGGIAMPNDNYQMLSRTMQGNDQLVSVGAAMAHHQTQRQRAYQQRMMPTRLARAQTTRAKRAARIAKLKEQHQQTHRYATNKEIGNTRTEKSDPVRTFVSLVH